MEEFNPLVGKLFYTKATRNAALKIGRGFPSKTVDGIFIN
jgi:hypothetical protein